MASQFMTIADVAETLNVSTAQVRSLINSGTLAAIQVGGRGQWRIERSVLDKYIEDGYEATRRRVANNDK